MPQIEQLSEVFASQLFWLIVTFGLIYFVIGRGMMPKIEATVEARDKRIAEDLAIAEQARASADEAEEAYRQRMADVRAEAMKVTQAAKQKSALEAEGRLAEADQAIGGKVASAEAGIEQARQAALAEIEAVAAEAARDMAAKLSGASVDEAAARKAVKEVLAHG
jgi:F-type H+-transporting ATPase subunit b